MKQHLHVAFSFLTILIQGKEYSTAAMQKSIYSYPFVGAVIFFLSGIISLFFLTCFHNYLLSALVFLACECILIRGLHHDGLADIADAMGSGKTGEEFRTVLKDSRIGSFGVIALLLYFLFGSITLSQLIEFNDKTNATYLFIPQMLFAGCWSRLGLLTLPLVSACYDPKDQKISLAKVLFANFQAKYFLIWYLVIFLVSALYFNAALPILCTTFSFLSTIPLYKLAKRENGYNGDFLGANCLLWELCSFLSLLLYYQH